MSAFDGLPKALRILCVRDGRAFQEIAHASKISPAMLSSYLSGRESPTLKTLEKLLDGLGLRLENLAAALKEIQERRDPEGISATDEQHVLGFPREAFERVFLEHLRRLGIEPKYTFEEAAAQTSMPVKKKG